MCLCCRTRRWAARFLYSKVSGRRPVNVVVRPLTASGAMQMKSIGTAWYKGRAAELDAVAIRCEIERFARLLSASGVESVRVWCSYNPDLPDDSPLQSPQRIVPPKEATAFFDEAVRNGVWKYGDVWNRAGVDALDGSFTYFLGNDKNITLETDDRHLLDETRSAWLEARYEVSSEE